MPAVVLIPSLRFPAACSKELIAVRGTQFWRGHQLHPSLQPLQLDLPCGIFPVEKKKKEHTSLAIFFYSQCMWLAVFIKTVHKTVAQEKEKYRQMRWTKEEINRLWSQQKCLIKDVKNRFCTLPMLCVSKASFHNAFWGLWEAML